MENENHVDLVAGDATYRVVVVSSEGRSAIVRAAKKLSPTGGGLVKLADGNTAPAQADVTVQLPAAGGGGTEVHGGARPVSSTELYRRRAEQRVSSSAPAGGEILPVVNR